MPSVLSKPTPKGVSSCCKRQEDTPLILYQRLPHSNGYSRRRTSGQELLSRLGRNKLHTELYIEKRFPMFGVRYIAINDNVDTDIGYISGGTQQDEESPQQEISA